MSNANAMKKQLRGPKVRNTKIGPYATPALPPPGNMALKVLKMATYHNDLPLNHKKVHVNKILPPPCTGASLAPPGGWPNPTGRLGHSIHPQSPR
jgi:hypothetical protein